MWHHREFYSNANSESVNKALSDSGAKQIICSAMSADTLFIYPFWNGPFWVLYAYQVMWSICVTAILWFTSYISIQYSLYCIDRFYTVFLKTIKKSVCISSFKFWMENLSKTLFIWICICLTKTHYWLCRRAEQSAETCSYKKLLESAHRWRTPKGKKLFCVQ